MRAAEGLGGLFSEMRLGVLAHNFGAREGGADINGEILFVSPVPARLTEGASPFLRRLATPRPHLGFSANTGGGTSKGYFGLTWTAPLAHDLLRPGDRLWLDLFFGGSVNDGKHASASPYRRSLGGNLLFRVGGEIGYRITRHLSASIVLDHDSNAGLARHNDGLNSIGLRLGVAF
ncbi:acyloxyacyl hydrolase [Caldovatus sp. SYSU G05006]|uniref:Acyloxyacyl hydrolase n=2 Tax=Caldovatus aquaticus TaxID=2865671 RepID=A0ABS7F305_9PROT|nr:acyloxyacyl hydrolase [Caldovatus aquaticus]